MEENRKAEESFTAEEQRVIDAARDLAALDVAYNIASRPEGMAYPELRLLALVRIKAERILGQTVGALLASERGAP